jgi:hypothetical protein
VKIIKVFVTRGVTAVLNPESWVQGCCLLQEYTTMFRIGTSSPLGFFHRRSTES